VRNTNFGMYKLKPLVLGDGLRILRFVARITFIRQGQDGLLDIAITFDRFF
jgi:hypothetical protein